MFIEDVVAQALPVDAVAAGSTGQEQANTGHPITFSVETTPPTAIQLMVSIDAQVVQALYMHALTLVKEHLAAPGFHRGNVPTAYLDVTHRPVILEHLKEFFFNYCVIDTLYHSIIEQQIMMIGEPVLVDLTLSPETGAHYIFSIPYIDGLYKNEWKRLPFKVPGRKNYKDLDRQVITFIKEEEARSQHLHPQAMVHDWVCLSIGLARKDGSLVIPEHTTRVWLKIGDEEADAHARALLVGRKVGESWHSQSTLIQQYLSKEFDLPYVFALTIIDIVPHAAFSIEQFKHHFKIKHNKDVHHKMIEIFSYRNDLSQRREIIEKAFKLAFDSYKVHIPAATIQTQAKYLLDALHSNPDYLVYKSHPSFQSHVKTLAQKQLQETAFVHAVAQHDKLIPTQQDTLGYLNLLTRQRTKEFVHFQLAPTRINDQEQPFNHEQLRLYVLREKALNHLLSCMNKKI